MVKEKIVFDCEDSLQMKTVAVLIQKASQYRSTIYLVRSGRRANAKSLLGVMSLGIENGAEIEIEADGDDAQEAVNALMSHLKNPKIAV
ncbi:MAG: HPr family phosphocarrier protein [Saccharofermentans sp.]|jgi:phosphotransferase system HPr (HPr) family protein|nr:HPr family phosphocarrier protein [Clostridiales bacterium]MBR3464543.1 HPr family phosphocarrier protein [Clostridiales bacterium]MCR5341334.1 HPr family phosphocarrier protein [Saccharofermentans sp.]